MEVFERRMLRLFVREIKKLENDNSPIDDYDMNMYRKSMFFSALMLRIAFIRLGRQILRPLFKSLTI